MREFPYRAKSTPERSSMMCDKTSSERSFKVICEEEAISSTTDE